MQGMSVEQGYEALANAIIIQAAKDFKDKCKMFKKRPNREEDIKAEADYKFFFSEWFSVLTSVDGSLIVREMQKEVWKR